jgi:DNA-binding MarR family transcriptional regulator
MNETPVSDPRADELDGETTMFALLAAARAVEDRLEVTLGAHGLSLAKLNVLNKLAEADRPLTLGEIASRLACVRSNVTQLVDRLEADGLVRREHDSVDRRSILAVLTEEGRDRQRMGAGEVRTAQAQLASSLGGHDRDAFERALKAIK